MISSNEGPCCLVSWLPWTHILLKSFWSIQSINAVSLSCLSEHLLDRGCQSSSCCGLLCVCVSSPSTVQSIFNVSMIFYKYSRCLVVQSAREWYCTLLFSLAADTQHDEDTCLWRGAMSSCHARVLFYFALQCFQNERHISPWSSHYLEAK